MLTLADKCLLRLLVTNRRMLVQGLVQAVVLGLVLGLGVGMALGLAPGRSEAADWIHWRGPEQNGVSRDRGIPESFGIRTPGQEHLLWRSDIGGRSTPLFMNNKLYLICAGTGSGLFEHERVVCLDADTGQLMWEKKLEVFHTDIVSSRLGWTNLTADPASNSVFCHGTQGNVCCFDATTGQVKWERNLTEEFGRITGYGGRIVSPTFDSGLVIVGMINSSWGNHTRGANRFVALDGTTGQVVWWAESPAPIKGTYYSNPVIAEINGVRLLIAGGGDGCVHAIKVRTGEIVWSHPFSAGVVNPSPCIDGTKVYISHGEENPEGGPIGRVVCLDAAEVDPATKRPKVVWEVKNLSKRFGLATGALADGIYYVPDDSSELVAFDAADGRVLWRQRYGTTSRGAPLIVDQKLFIFDVNGILTIMKLNGRRKPEILDEIIFRPSSGVGVQETHGTPICVNGRLYFCTRENTYCIAGEKSSTTSKTQLPVASASTHDRSVTPGPAVGLMVFPAEVTASAGEQIEFRAKFIDADGRETSAPEGALVEWSLPALPPPPNAKTGPPPLRGTLKPEGMKASVLLDPVPSQQGYVQAKAGSMLSPLARVRVAPSVPYAHNFDSIPEGAAPGGWVNTNGKFAVKLVEGNGVLAKVNNDSRPPFARANAYITRPTERSYVIECDVRATEVRGKLPDMGVVNSRYSLVLDGKPDPAYGDQRTLRVIAWEALPRINRAVAFNWLPETWYRLKFAVHAQGESAQLMGKVWERDRAEPKDWMIEFNDPNPYRYGAAALYGYVTNMLEQEVDGSQGREKRTLPGSEIYYDNLNIKPLK